MAYPLVRSAYRSPDRSPLHLALQTQRSAQIGLNRSSHCLWDSLSPIPLPFVGLISIQARISGLANLLASEQYGYLN